MKRLAAVAVLTGAALGIAAPAAFAATTASPSVCVDLNVSLQGQGTAQHICLPPAQ